MVSSSFKEAAYASQTDEVIIALVTFSSDQLAAPILITTDPYEMLPLANVRGVVSNGDEYIYLPFEIYLPQDDESGVTKARIRVDNVDRRMVAAVRSVTKPINIKIQIVLSSNVDLVEMEFDNFQLSNVNYDAYSIEGDLTLNFWNLEPFPSGRFTPSNFPGLF